VRELVQNLPKQGKFSNPARPAASKLAVDPYLRVVGARDMIALGDCSMMLGNRLPATAQVRDAATFCLPVALFVTPLRGNQSKMQRALLRLLLVC
jgi:NADH dehydrogenase FAD-containing subunit